MVEATISSKGQIVIPKSVRERLHLKAGMKVSIEVQGEALIMKRFDRGFPDWRAMRGMFGGGPDLLEDLTGDRAAEIVRDHVKTTQDR